MSEDFSPRPEAFSRCQTKTYSDPVFIKDDKEPLDEQSIQAERSRIQGYWYITRYDDVGKSSMQGVSSGSQEQRVSRSVGGLDFQSQRSSRADENIEAEKTLLKQKYNNRETEISYLNILYTNADSL